MCRDGQNCTNRLTEHHVVITPDSAVGAALGPGRVMGGRWACEQNSLHEAGPWGRPPPTLRAREHLDSALGGTASEAEGSFPVGSQVVCQEPVGRDWDSPCPPM